MDKIYTKGYPSVTQVLGILRKLGLEKWFLQNTAAFCNQKSAEGKTIGGQIHDLIQSYIDGAVMNMETDYPEQVRNALESFFLFSRMNPKIRLKKAEIPMESDKYGLCGTLDCLAKDGKELIIADWKTGECKEKPNPPIYPEMGYQIAAYVFLYEDIFKTYISRARILVLAKDKVAFNTLELGLEELRANWSEVVLPCLKIYNRQKSEMWLRNHERGIVSNGEGKSGRTADARAGTGVDSGASGGKGDGGRAGGSLPDNF